MNAPHAPNLTADLLSSAVPPDSLDAGLAKDRARLVELANTDDVALAKRPADEQ